MIACRLSLSLAMNAEKCVLMVAMLEVEDGARNVTGLDGFVSLGKSRVTKKEF